MSEDDYQTYRGNAAEIMTSQRHVDLNMLRAESSKKASIQDCSYEQSLFGEGFSG
ncbi:hypothetical protein [Photobacterium damselae]|uniref:hypothetical protein n=1 Tax=Photobacterium damselae TaxID=38293 RepID=UPI004069493F